MSQELLLEGAPAVEEDELPRLEMLNADEPVPDAGEAPPLAVADASAPDAREDEGPSAPEAVDEGAAGVRAAAKRVLARLRSFPPWAGIVAAVVVLGGTGLACC